MVDQKRYHGARALLGGDALLQVAHKSSATRGDLHSLADEELIETANRIIEAALLLGIQLGEQSMEVGRINDLIERRGECLVSLLLRMSGTRFEPLLQAKNNGRRCHSHSR